MRRAKYDNVTTTNTLVAKPHMALVQVNNKDMKQRN